MAKQTVPCPICDAQINIGSDLEESEIINCPDCRSRLVVEQITNGQVTLGQAPEVEEDWGE